MKTIARFSFKFKKLDAENKLSNYRTVIEFHETKKAYQVVVYQYKGKNIIDILPGQVSTYTFCADAFFYLISIFRDKFHL